MFMFLDLQRPYIAIIGLILLLTKSVYGQVSNGTGLATIIYTGPGPVNGACGIEYGPDDLVAGVPTSVFNSGEVCSKTVAVTCKLFDYDFRYCWHSFLTPGNIVLDLRSRKVWPIPGCR
ncbi:hypothetical protein C8J55DRAFT_515280 [Lentinula edodes]|uniref:Uncharacterized protein n=1 Tax=Lentinula lateritia TaxID=40482 RepID=A0A9W9ACB4_9AGAR|nr:hypothetical protein C8J55DRAFT_515280 [Lentinula edodes]